MEAGPAGDPGVGVGAQTGSETVVLPVTEKAFGKRQHPFTISKTRALSEFGIQINSLT